MGHQFSHSAVVSATATVAVTTSIHFADSVVNCTDTHIAVADCAIDDDRE